MNEAVESVQKTDFSNSIFNIFINAILCLAGKFTTNVTNNYHTA